ncbi:MAG: hypothetical protein OEZ32_10620 [Nitrospinota bacterium]|nr:hypothetical protein [Nitrospinota bacterium]
MTESSIMVSAPARLHLGLVKTSDQPGFIAAGLSLASPRLEMEVTLRSGNASRNSQGRAATAVLSHLGLKDNVSIEIRTPLPPHQGFGSGTRMALAAAAGALRLAGERMDILQMTRLAGRGGRSAMGAVLFAKGGLAADVEGRIVRTEAPGNWRVVLISPALNGVDLHGLHGSEEEGKIHTMPPCSSRVKNRVEDEAVAGLIGGAASGDFGLFEGAVAAIQAAAARQFGALQGGAASTENGRAILRRLRKGGVRACGQSSWGPALFAITPTTEHAKDLSNWLQLLPGVAGVRTTRIDNGGKRFKAP